MNYLHFWFLSKSLLRPLVLPNGKDWTSDFSFAFSAIKIIAAAIIFIADKVFFTVKTKKNNKNSGWPVKQRVIALYLTKLNSPNLFFFRTKCIH